jgi:RimJ/RimL family protein N-acetyltransferase
MTVVLQTPRLRLKHLGLEDAAFITRLYTDADFVRFIGDRRVHDDQSAAAYLRAGPLAMYASHGFGLWKVERLADGEAVGICGLLKRPALDDVDVGYALLPEHRGNGYAIEAVRATLAHAKTAFGLPRVLAIVSPDNAVSIALLEKAGLRFERETRLSPESDAVRVHAIELATAPD